MAFWYATAKMMPPRGVRVRVLWDGRVFEAALVVRPGKRFETCWLTQHKGAAVYLPLNLEERIAVSRRVLQEERPRPWLGFQGVASDDPDFWRPVDAATWRMPLPSAAFEWDEKEAPRMWAERSSFEAVDAALLAAEMEGDREAARGCGASPEPPPERQWWLDPLAVTHSPPGSVTPREAEGRLMRAFIAERWVSGDGPGWLSDGGDDLPPLRIEPTGKDQDDMLTALSWLHGLRADDEQVLRLRGQTPALTWRAIGTAMKISHEGARNLYRDALALVTEAANGKVTAHAASVRRDLEAVREANRRFKRGSAEL